MSRRAALIVVLVLAVAGLAVSAAGASPKKHAVATSSHLLVGINDEADTLYGNPVTGFQALKALGAQVLRVNLYWGGTQVGRVARREAHRSDRPGRSRVQLVALRPSRCGTRRRTTSRSSSRSCSRRSGRTAARRRTVAPTNANELQDFAVRGGHALQRLLRAAELAAAADARGPDGAASGGDALDRLERAEQSGLPLAAVQARRRRTWVDRERRPVREDLQRRLCGHPRGRHSPGEKVACGVTAPKGNDAPRRRARRSTRSRSSRPRRRPG